MGRKNTPPPRRGGGGAFLSDAPLIGGPKVPRKPPRGGCAVTAIALLGGVLTAVGATGYGLWSLVTLVA